LRIGFFAFFSRSISYATLLAARNRTCVRVRNTFRTLARCVCVCVHVCVYMCVCVCTHIGAGGITEAGNARVYSCVCVHMYVCVCTQIGAGGITKAGNALFQIGLTTLSRDERVSNQPPHYRHRHQHLPRDCHVTVQELGAHPSSHELIPRTRPRHCPVTVSELGTHTLVGAYLSRCIYVWIFYRMVWGGGG
jgi:hypothetical protein